jgi:glutamate synthase (NADPH/NADH) small chain
LAPQIKLIKVYAPEIAKKAQAGQFVIIRTDKEAERIPLTLVDWRGDIGVITLIFQEVGVSTKRLGRLRVDDDIFNVAGPLGNPSNIRNYGSTAVVCGGVGTAAAFPIARALKNTGNNVISIMGARNKGLLILEGEMKTVSDKLYVSTDDGSKGYKGFVSEVLKALIEKGHRFDIVYAIGPPLMMKATAEVTRPYGIKTIVSLNPIMVDGMGMCGACRVSVGSSIRFACVDGPDFDAHQVNFDELIKRLRTYSPEEKLSAQYHEKLGIQRSIEHAIQRQCLKIPRKTYSEKRRTRTKTMTRLAIPAAETPAIQDRWHCITMPKQPPKERIHNFDEVALGYTEEQAAKEASRCLTCPDPQCVKGCPVGLDIPAFIKLIKEKKCDQAIRKVKEKNILPAICGRVCPQEEQCQKLCTLGKKGEPVSIGRLERFVADLELKRGVAIPPRVRSTGKKVAIIGAGPAGLTAAAELAKLGHKVTVFEALHLAGGVLIYGIPEFRLPKNIVHAEVEYIKKLGVEIYTDALIGRLYTIKELFGQGFEAVFIGTGAGLPQFLEIPGENLSGIYSANEFLIRTNLMKSYLFPLHHTPIKIGDRVAVIGGGNVAMDSARTALRLGAKSVSIVYRRSREETPARKEEILNAEEEGIVFKFLVSPTKFLGDEQGRVNRMEYVAMKLGELDESGRRKPVQIVGSEALMEVDTVIVAIGRNPNPIIQSTTKGLETTKKRIIVTEKETGKTSLEGVYAGGDIATGEATVISAMGAGKRAAKAIHSYLIKDEGSQVFIKQPHR